MHNIFTKTRRFISERQAIVGALLICTALTAHLQPQSFGGWAEMVFMLCMGAIAIVLVLGWVTVRKRGQYLELAKASTEMFGGQAFVDTTLRYLAMRVLRPQLRNSDHSYDIPTQLFARLGYKVNEAGLPAYLPR